MNERIPKGIGFLRFFDKRRAVLLSFVVPFCIQGILLLVAYFAFGAGVTGMDCAKQYTPFYAELYRKLREGGSLFFSWNGGAGYDFWSVFCYYLSSPLTPFMFLFQEEQLLYFINILVIIKTSLCGLTFASYLEKKKYCTAARQTVLFATLYAMSGFCSAYAVNLLWFDTVALFPLVLLGMEKLVYEKKPVLYIACLSLSMICNYYMGFLVCVAVFFYYFTFRFNNIRDFAAKSLRILLCSGLSAGLCAVFMIPSFKVASAGGHQTGGAGGYGLLGNVFNSIRNFLFADVPQSSSSLPNTAAVYITLFALFFVFLYFIAHKAPAREKIIAGLTAVFLLVSLNIGVLNRLWHGFRMPILVTNRFSFILEFLLLTLAARAFSARAQLDRKKAVWAAVLFGIFVFTLCCADASNVPRFLLNLCAAAFYLVLFFVPKLRRAYPAVFAVCAVAGVTVCFSLALLNGTGYRIATYYNNDLAAAVRTEEGFYREKLVQEEDDTPSTTPAEIRRETYHAMPANACSLYGMRTMDIFNSYLDNEYMLLAGVFGEGGADLTTSKASGRSYAGMQFGSNYIHRVSPNAFTDMLFGVRYVYSLGDTPTSLALTQVAHSGEATVLENRYALPIGYMIPRTLTEKSEIGGNLNYAFFNLIADEAASVRVYNICKLQCSVPDGATCTSNGNDVYTLQGEGDIPVDFTYTARQEERLAVYYSGHSIGAVEIFVNESRVHTMSYKGMDMPEIGMVNAGDTVRICVKSFEGPLSVRLVGIDTQSFEAVYTALADEGLELTAFGDDYLRGTVNTKTDGDLLLTFPVSEGWTFTVDGKETEPHTFCYAFPVLPLTAGTHEITAQYRTPAFRESLLATLGSLAVFTALCAGQSIKKKRMKLV